MRIKEVDARQMVKMSRSLFRRVGRMSIRRVLGRIGPSRFGRHWSDRFPAGGAFWKAKQMMLIGRLRSRALVARADAARDVRDWNAAADLYRRALEVAPARTGAWVQLGHALKESGDYPEAAEAYLRALALRPRSAEIHLQIGHLEKLMGNRGAAAASYARALALGRGANEAADELQRLGHSLDVDGSSGRVERSPFAPKGQRSDVEFRLDALSEQITTFLEHVSTTKALAFEVARCKAGIEELRSMVAGRVGDGAADGLTTDARDHIAGRVSVSPKGCDG